MPIIAFPIKVNDANVVRGNESCWKFIIEYYALSPCEDKIDKIFAK